MEPARCGRGAAARVVGLADAGVGLVGASAAGPGPAAQGLRGTPYRFLTGDLPEETRLLAASRSGPPPVGGRTTSSRVSRLSSTLPCSSTRMSPAFSACCRELISRWENSIGSIGRIELDVWPEFQNLTGDVISRAAFGSSYQEGRRIFQLQAEQAEHLVRAFQSTYIPGSTFLPTENNRRMKSVGKEINAILRIMIGKREGYEEW